MDCGAVYNIYISLVFSLQKESRDILLNYVINIVLYEPRRKVIIGPKIQIEMQWPKTSFQHPA
jgi:hypothetical protein